MNGPIFLHNFSRPLAERAKSRRCCGPYRWTPAQPGKGRGFYSASNARLEMGDAPLRLRLTDAADHLGDSRLAYTTGYFCDDDGCGDTLQPVVALLPRGRGFLAGWTMGEGMCGAVDPEIYSNPRDAAYAAHSMAEADAEANREANREDEDDEF